MRCQVSSTWSHPLSHMICDLGAPGLASVVWSYTANRNKVSPFLDPKCKQEWVPNEKLKCWTDIPRPISLLPWLLLSICKLLASGFSYLCTPFIPFIPIWTLSPVSAGNRCGSRRDMCPSPDMTLKSLVKGSNTHKGNWSNICQTLRPKRIIGFLWTDSEKWKSSTSF